jgi:hypothetical protein
MTGRSLRSVCTRSGACASPAASACMRSRAPAPAVTSGCGSLTVMIRFCAVLGLAGGLVAFAESRPSAFAATDPTGRAPVDVPIEAPRPFRRLQGLGSRPSGRQTRSAVRRAATRCGRFLSNRCPPRASARSSPRHGVHRRRR